MSGSARCTRRRGYHGPSPAVDSRGIRVHEYAGAASQPPTGWVEESNFTIVETPVPKPGLGEVLVKIRSCPDPYMRGRMSDAKSYAQPVDRPGDGRRTVGEWSSRAIPSSNRATSWSAPRVAELCGSSGEGLMKIDP